MSKKLQETIKRLETKRKLWRAQHLPVDRATALPQLKFSEKKEQE